MPTDATDWEVDARASPTVGKRRLTLGTRIRQLRHENVTDDRPGNARRRDV